MFAILLKIIFLAFHKSFDQKVSFCHFLKKQKQKQKQNKTNKQNKTAVLVTISIPKMYTFIHITVTVWKLQRSIYLKKNWVDNPLIKRPLKTYFIKSHQVSCHIAMYFFYLMMCTISTCNSSLYELLQKWLVYLIFNMLG